MLDQLSFDFFKSFSLSENILLKKGYAKLNDDNMVIGLNWEKFAREDASIQNVINNGKCSDHIQYLCNEPPKRLCKHDDGFIWVESSNNHKINPRNLIKALRQLRNNLFHGAKYENAVFSDPIRTEKLLTAGCSVITELLSELR